jgi:hypothetical protein
LASSILYDESDPLILVMTLPGHPLSEEQFRANLREMDEFASRAHGGPFGFVIDTRGAPDPDAARRRAIAEYWDDCLRRHGASFVGAAIAMSSLTGRAVFKAILWLRNTPLFLIPVPTPEEGLALLRPEIAKVTQRSAR